jgi:long-chain acyl-CoA synthetase
MRSPALMLGYYKEPEQSRDAFTADGWLRTGDKGRIDAQGCLHITGRVKDLFKTGKGKYVAPAPIEDKLGTHESVEACVVTGCQPGSAARYRDAQCRRRCTRRPMRRYRKAALEASLAAAPQAVSTPPLTPMSNCSASCW